MRPSASTPLLVLAVAYVPGMLLVASLFGAWAGVSVDFRRDYSPCSPAVEWPAPPSASHRRRRAYRSAAGAALILGVTALFLSVLMFFAVRTVVGAGNAAAAAIALLSWICWPESSRFGTR